MKGNTSKEEKLRIIKWPVGRISGRLEFNRMLDKSTLKYTVRGSVWSKTVR
jgi:hypothetical protein